MPLALVVLIWVIAGAIAFGVVGVFVYAFVIAKMMKDFH